MSDVVLLTSGVLQGSGIGPLLFLMYVNEIIYTLEKCNIKMNLLADDVRCIIKL